MTMSEKELMEYLEHHQLSNHAPGIFFFKIMHQDFFFKIMHQEFRGV
jgi:hypothetical protein